MDRGQQARWTYLAVSVLYGGNIRLAEGALDEAEDERRFTDATGAKHHHPVVVALLRHAADDNVDIANTAGRYADGGDDGHEFPLALQSSCGIATIRLDRPGSCYYMVE